MADALDLTTVDLTGDSEGEARTALVLTEQEWRDLAVICEGYLFRAVWRGGPDGPRERALAHRILTAAKS